MQLLINQASDLTIFLSLGWGIILITFCFLILFYPNSRSSALRILKSKQSRVIVAMIAIGLGLIQIVGYNLIFNGQDLLLISLGWLLIINGVLALTSPELIQFIEQTTLQKLIVLLWLIMAGAGSYLLYKALSSLQF